MGEDEFNVEDFDTLLAECDSCGIVRPVKLLADPFIDELYPEDENESEWFCANCYSDRKDEV